METCIFWRKINEDVDCFHCVVEYWKSHPDTVLDDVAAAAAAAAAAGDNIDFDVLVDEEAVDIQGDIVLDIDLAS